MPSVYDYLDYRHFLKDSVSALRENRKFSFRLFNRRAGFRSSATLKLVMDGARNLAPEGICKVAKGLKLTATESDFFTHLVLMNQSTTHEERDLHFRKIVACQPFREAKKLTTLQYESLSHWYCAAILELVRFDDFREDAAWIARRLTPAVPISEIRRTLTNLEQLQFLTRDATGRLQPSAASFATPDEVTSLSVVNFYKELCDLSKHALLSKPADQRDFSSLTIAVSAKGFREIKAKIQKFKRELDAYLESDPLPRTQVAQISFNVFALSKEGLS